jgi:hypothetical protein
MGPDEGALPDDTTDDAGFDDGFDNPSPTVTPETQEEAAEETAVPKAPSLDERLAAAEALIDSLRSSQEKSSSTAFGKIGGIERTLQQFQAGAQVEIAQEDIDAMRADGFESHAKALEKIRSLRALPGGSTDPAQIDELVQQRIAPALTAVEQKFELRLLAKEHPDYKDIDADPAFAQWVATQPEQFRNSLAEASRVYDSDVVGAAMTKFKAARKPAPSTPNNSTRRSLIEAAVTPRGTGGNPAATTEDDEFDAGFKQR